MCLNLLSVPYTYIDRQGMAVQAKVYQCTTSTYSYVSAVVQPLSQILSPCYHYCATLELHKNSIAEDSIWGRHLDQDQQLYATTQVTSPNPATTPHPQKNRNGSCWSDNSISVLM